MEQELLAAEQVPDQLTAAELPPVYTDQNGQQPRDQCPQSLHHVCQETRQPVYYKSVPLMVHINAPTVSKSKQEPTKISVNYSAKQLWADVLAHRIGATTVALSIITFIFAIVASALRAEHYEVGAGYWCGIVFFIAGIASVRAGKSGTDCEIIICLISAISSWAFAAALLGISADGAKKDVENSGWKCSYDYYNSGYWSQWSTSRPNCYTYLHAAIAANAVLIAMATIELGLSSVLVYLCGRTLLQLRFGLSFTIHSFKFHLSFKSNPDDEKDATKASSVTGFATVQMQDVSVPLDKVHVQDMPCPEAVIQPGNAAQLCPA